MGLLKSWFISIPMKYCYGAVYTTQKWSFCCAENLQNKPINQIILFKKKEKVGERLLQGIQMHKI